MSSFKLLLALLFYSSICGDEKIESLCENPDIHAADHLVNGSVRLYRDNHYWELKGLPNRKASTEGPFKIWWFDFAPVRKNMATVTILSGLQKGLHYQFSGPNYKSWYPGGGMKDGDKVTSDPIYPTSGFHSAYHDGNLSGLGYPMLVGLRQMHVWYYDTTSFRNRWQESPKSENQEGFRNGHYNEHFPGDITSSFMWPSDDPKVKYYVYLFKGHKYCYRSWQSNDGKECEEWRENRELFGCMGSDPPKAEPADSATNETTAANFSLKSDISSLLLLTIICLKIYL